MRPAIKEDGTGSQTDIVVTYDPDDDGIIYISNKGRIQTFDFDKVFSNESTQTQVMEIFSAVVSSKWFQSSPILKDSYKHFSACV